MSNSVFLRNPAETTRNRETISFNTNNDDKENSAFVKILGYDQNYEKNEYDNYPDYDYSDIDHTVGDDKTQDTYA